MPRNEISTSRFAVSSFRRALIDASGGYESTRQIDYLARYCKRLGAKTVVREEHYIDRHFLDEHALYYCRNLDQPSNAVRRFHVFSRAFNERELSDVLERRARLQELRGQQLDERWSRDYLGFISIRPIPSVPVGRTVLRRLEDGPRRDIWATGSYSAHLASLTLRVPGLAFQQQDVAVGACATAALWSALSRVARHDGIRAPTPAQVSEAAGRHSLPHGRTLPAVSGLTVGQLSDAIRNTGFAPEAVRADIEPEFFVAALHAYLLSGFPVLLALHRPGGGHAVTAVGFQVARAPEPALETSVPVRSSRLRKLYVHDDRLGPYARAFLMAAPNPTPEKVALVLQLETRRTNRSPADEPDRRYVENWVVDSALVPVYPKLRLPVRSLITLADALGDVVEDRVGAARAPQLSVDFYYERSGRYLAGLEVRDGRKLAPFLRSVSLSRWCGVVRWFLGSKKLIEFVYDTTDILRDSRQHGRELLRAIVCHDPAFRSRFRDVAVFFDVPYA